MDNPAPGFSQFPNHRITATRTPSHVRVLAGGREIADSRAAFLVHETRHDPVWYLPPEDVERHVLAPSETRTYCPFKGYASYWTIELPDARLEDAVWAYLEPYDECRSLTGYFAFYPDRVTIEVDGEPQRPT